ncbi:MAG: antibiotic biosynthesis monooxygenase [Nitrospira sp.]|nr:antibiotic biosynthesis monooxygenase [Nitrospira sp.]
MTDSSPITIVVQFKTKPGQEDHAKAVVNRILPGVLSEEGNMNVLMFQDPNDSTRFMFVETFTSREAEKAHTQTDYMQRFYKEIAEPLDGESTLEYWRPYGMHQGAGANVVTFPDPR